MSRRIILYVLRCLILCTSVYAFGQGTERGGGRGAAAPLPDNAQSVAHMEAAKKIANNYPVLMNPWSSFCMPRDFNKPGPELEPTKVFDNLYAIPSSPVQTSPPPSSKAGREAFRPFHERSATGFDKTRVLTVLSG